MPGILTGIAGVLTGILAIVQVVKPLSPSSGTSQPNPTNTVAQSNQTVTVDSTSEQGNPFKNPENKPIQVSFHAEGKWSLIPKNVTGDDLPKGYISPDGDGNFAANPKKLCPGYPLGALIVKTQQGQCIVVGANGSFELRTGEIIYFAANDVKGLYEDNDGSVNVVLNWK
ncbi:hypothetical protein NSMS1_12700 [Nostoc sp. MS1]|nr:hypothetical protein NSMS1_12700 [Nostoc sp. MS1]